LRIDFERHLPIESPDEIVIAKAQEFAAILLSLNGDFADSVVLPLPRNPVMMVTGNLVPLERLDMNLGE
jgi:predicted nuclease of predicted toxin-antitoxin system